MLGGATAAVATPPRGAGPGSGGASPERPDTIERLRRDLATVAHGGAENVEPNAGAVRSGGKPACTGPGAARRGLALHGGAADAELRAASTAAPPACVETVGTYDISSPGFGLSTDFMRAVQARVRWGPGHLRALPALPRACGRAGQGAWRP